MSTNTNRAWMIIGLIVLGAAGVAGWTTYYLEKQEHDANTAQLAAEIQNHQRHIDALTGKSDRSLEMVSTAENSTNMGQQSESDRGQQKEGETLQEGLVLTESEQARLIVERDTLSENLEMIRNEQGQLKQELEKIETEREQLRSDLQETRSVLDQVTEELGQKVKAREQALSESSNRAESINAQLLAASGQIDNLQKERQEIQVRFIELQQKLESDLQSKDVEIEQLKGNMTVIRLAADILFDPGSAALRDSGRNALALIAAALNEIPDRQNSLEGHTDSVPISERLQEIYATNWELSTARAARAARYLQSRGIAPERMRAVGYGPYQPVAENADPEMRALNRRLEIMLLPAGLEIRDYEASN